MSFVCYDYAYKDSAQYLKEFIGGINCLKVRSLEQAHMLFEHALASVTHSDVYYNKYASFCGFLRVLHGDHGGLTLCRQVASREPKDGDVFLNLARSELFYDSRKNAVDAIIKGLEIDDTHLALQQLQQDIGMRETRILPWLRRGNPVNIMVGKLFRKKERPWEGVYPFRL